MTKFTVDSVAAIVIYYLRFHGKEGYSEEVL